MQQLLRNSELRVANYKTLLKDIYNIKETVFSKEDFEWCKHTVREFKNQEDKWRKLLVNELEKIYLWKNN